MPECANTHLQQRRISKFFRGGPPDPPETGGKGQGGKGSIGKGRGREEKGAEGREGRGVPILQAVGT